MEILFEYRGSRRQLDIAEKESITQYGRGQRPDIYLLQRWSNQWDCYVDVGHCNEVVDGDKLAVIAKPKPPSMLYLLCCCGSDSSYSVGKVGGSGKTKIPKTEEIQSLEYRFRTESEAGSVLEESYTVQDGNNLNTSPGEGERYIRAESGRAAWKLVENSVTAQDDSILSPPTESEQFDQEQQEQRISEGAEEEDEVEEGEELSGAGGVQQQGGEIKEEEGEEDGDKEEGEEGGEDEERGRVKENMGEKEREGEEEEEVATSQEDGRDEIEAASESSIAPAAGAAEGMGALDSVKDSDSIESNKEVDIGSPQAEDEIVSTTQLHDASSLSHDDNGAMADTSQSHDETAEATDTVRSHDNSVEEEEKQSAGESASERVENPSDKREGDDGHTEAEEPVSQ